MRYFNVTHFLNVIIFGEQTFSGLLLFSWVAFLNWFSKSSRFEEGFNDNELLWSFSKSIHWMVLLSVFVQQARTFLLLDKELKGKIVPSTFYAIPGFISVLKIPVIQIIKIVTFNMNSKFTEVTLNSFNFVIFWDIFCTNLAWKYRIIDITHGFSSCLLHSVLLWVVFDK